MSDHKIEPTKKDNPADRYGVVVTEKGPYLVYGRPPLNLQSIRLGPRPGGPGARNGRVAEGQDCRAGPKTAAGKMAASQPGRQAELPAQRQRPGYPTKSGCPLGQQPK